MIRLLFAAIGAAVCRAIPAAIAERAEHATAAFKTPAAPSRRATDPADGTSPTPSAGSPPQK